MFKITRRGALQGAAGLLAMPALVERANAQSAFDWKQAKGERLEVSLTSSPRSAILIQNQKEFEELTGIRVGAEHIPEQQHRQKFAIEFSTGKPSFDVVGISLHVNKRQVGRAKWCADLRPYLNDASLTAPDFDFADFSQGAVAYSTQADGRMDTLPEFGDPWIMYYNKDLLAAKNIAVPKTFDELYTAAKALNDPSKQVYGFVGRGLRNANVVLWTSFLLGTQQRDTIDANMKLITDTPDAVWAAEMYQKMMRECAPPGSIGFNWNECQTSFMQGRAAFWIDGPGFAAPLEDPKRSRVAGKTGYAVAPAGPANHHGALFGNGFGISEASAPARKKAAWLYLQWASGKANQLRYLSSGAGAPARQSAFRNEEAIRNSTFPAQYFSTLGEALRIARPGLPEIVPVTEFRDTIGAGLTNMIGGADPATELRKATEAFRPVLEQSEKAS
ncbi:ABC transporter substrate-binding protein [Roseomonas marmotae]|uniref:Sugar ABC transporter substrate-binding protein n=1 Tax=Roseomonas marmotae TaxID=2768161 RepID=A0ABS3K6W4_9PROT|nr:sugar ABC transporter substrate-binding protein [Roseomonas marmotae]MBO1073198.1 sugar ABC transporter substrate-binding protein [Roseomonas marmotae]QTI79171.1 sugar ABC transporter substrate-binding protein [Roseomonas marmotae]